ncbi:MAG: hypothetical protein HC828_08730 [Blastochloris sp.]|nr:hypothetical protein [Blastochloris sp.]
MTYDELEIVSIRDPRTKVGGSDEMSNSQSKSGFYIPFPAAVTIVIGLLASAAGVTTFNSNSTRNLEDRVVAMNLAIQDQLNQLNLKLVSVEASRFSSADALVVWKEIAAQKEIIVKLQERQLTVVERLAKLESK